MPAKSKAQQRFFGMVDAYKKGELDHPSKAIKDAAKSMTRKEIKKFAKTKHKGLPEKVKNKKVKENITMNKNVIRLNESQLQNIIFESVKKILTENMQKTPKVHKLSWDKILDEITYPDIDNEDTMNKNAEEVGEMIRNYIRSFGWDCLEDSYFYEDDEKEWFQDNHPEISLDDCEESSIADLEFLCDTEDDARNSGRSIDYKTFAVTFYGIYGKVGVFYVEEI